MRRSIRSKRAARTTKFRSGDHAESLEIPRNRHRGRRLLQRLVRPGQPQAATVKMTARPASAAFL
jgi:hypothetical protein